MRHLAVSGSVVWGLAETCDVLLPSRLRLVARLIRVSVVLAFVGACVCPACPFFLSLFAGAVQGLQGAGQPAVVGVLGGSGGGKAVGCLFGFGGVGLAL